MTQSKDITMPSLGADMTEGMLVEWLVNVGEQVHNGQVIAVLETEKGAIDMEVYYDGTITELLVQPVNTVPVGTVLAKLALTEEEFSAEPNTNKQTADHIQPRKIVQEPKQNQVKHQEVSQQQVTQQQVTQQEVTQQKVTKQKVTGEQIEQGKANIQQSQAGQFVHARIMASPLVKKIAKDNTLDLSKITGSGPHGALLLKDIEQLLEVKIKDVSLEKTKKTGVETTAMRSAIAAAMVKSKQTIPHFYLSRAIEVNKAQQFLQQLNQDTLAKDHILLIALLLKAVALTLQKFPELNGFYLNEQFEASADINIANVISLRTGGVVVPALRNVERLSVSQIMTALKDVVSRARSMETDARLRSSELQGASITVTNMGDRGADSVFGVIYPPQVAIIGFGEVQKVPQVRDENISIGEQLTVSLSADHRVIDGMLAGKFLNVLAKKIQKPERL